MEIVKQISLTLPNTTNCFALMSDALRSVDVNIEAICCRPSNPHTTICMVVSDPVSAEQALNSLGHFSFKDILKFEMRNEVGGVGNIARALSSSHINIEYVYATSLLPHKMITVYMSVDNVESACSVLDAWRENGRRL